MTKNKKITVDGREITILRDNEKEFISLTDMLQAKDGEFFSDWLRNRNTIEYLGEWEKLYNPNFNYTDFGTIRNEAGSNNFVLSVRD